jgi:hypothetical protein
VFDKRRDTISLRPLVRAVKKGGQLQGQDAAAVDALLVKAEPVVDKVRILRNKAVAHQSARIKYDDVFKMAAVKPTQLRDLTDMALEIANHLRNARGLPDEVFTEFPREAAEEMMRALGVKRSQRRQHVGETCGDPRRGSCDACLVDAHTHDAHDPRRTMRTTHDAHERTTLTASIRAGEQKGTPVDAKPGCDSLLVISSKPKRAWLDCSCRCNSSR